MAGDGNKVGEVYVEIKATGAENVAKEVQKAQAMATAPALTLSGSGGAARLLGAAANTAGGGLGFSATSPMADVSAWAAVTQETNKATAAAVNFGEKAAGAGSKSVNALQQAKAAVSSIAGSAGFGPIPGIIARISALLGPIGLAVTTLTGGVLLFAGAWLKARENAARAREEIGRIQLEFDKFADSLARPASDFAKTIASIEAEATKAKDNLFEQYKKEEGVFGDTAQAYERYQNERNKIDTKSDLLIRQLQQKRNADAITDSVESDAKAEQKKFENKEKNADRERQLEKALADEVVEMKQRALLEGLDPAAAARVEGEAAIAAVRERLIGTQNLEKQMLEELLRATIEFYGKKERAASESADKIKQDEIKKAQESANIQAKAISEAYSKATADIMANFANQQSQSMEEMVQYLQLIAEGAGRN